MVIDSVRPSDPCPSSIVLLKRSQPYSPMVDNKDKRNASLIIFMKASSSSLGLVSIRRQMLRPRHKKSDYKVEQSSFTLIALF